MPGRVSRTTLNPASSKVWNESMKYRVCTALRYCASTSLRRRLRTASRVLSLKNKAWIWLVVSHCASAHLPRIRLSLVVNFTIGSLREFGAETAAVAAGHARQPAADRANTQKMSAVGIGTGTLPDTDEEDRTPAPAADRGGGGYA